MATRSSRLGAVLFFLASTACGTSSSLVTSDDAALQTASAGDDGGGRAPQAAVDACADLTLDDDCTFTGRNGESVSGTCQDVPGGELACVPAGGADCNRGQGGSGGQGGQGPGGARQGPPPAPPQAAVDACASLAADAACSFAGKDGETVSGTCQAPPDGTALACAPARDDQHPGPPAEAIAACASAAEDDACTFAGKDDESLSGTCKHGPDGDTTHPLACAPARPPQS